MGFCICIIGSKMGLDDCVLFGWCSILDSVFVCTYFSYLWDRAVLNCNEWNSV